MMAINTEMIQLRQKYKQYNNANEILNDLYPFIRPKYQLFPCLHGGTICQINDILHKYSDLNMKIDLLESSDENIYFR